MHGWIAWAEDTRQAKPCVMYEWTPMLVSSRCDGSVLIGSLTCAWPVTFGPRCLEQP